MNPTSTPASSSFSSTPNPNAAEVIQQELGQLLVAGVDAATSGGSGGGGGGRGPTEGAELLVGGVGDAASGGGGGGGGRGATEDGAGDGGDAGQGRRRRDAVAHAGAGVDGDGDQLENYFDEHMCYNLAEQGKWSQLDDYLRQLLDSNAQVIASHPVLILPVRRMIALSRLHSSVGDALEYFNSSIAPLEKDFLKKKKKKKPLEKDDGLFIPLSGYVKREVQSIKDKLEAKDESTDFLDKEDFVECIFDYIRLYFPALISHNQGSRVKKQEATWNLTLILKDEAGMPKKSKGKIHYRCLACGWTGGSTCGIKALRIHLVGDDGRKPSCYMTTPRIYQLLGVEPPQALQMKAPRIGQKRKRQSGTRQYDNQGDPGQSSSANPELLLLDPVASLSEPETGRELNLHGRHEQELTIEDYLFSDTSYEIDFSLLDHLFEPSKGFMDAVLVLNSRRSMSKLVDLLVHAIPDLEFVQKARGSLQSMLECCNDLKTIGSTTMVNAEVVMQSLAKMRGALSSVDCQLLLAKQVLNQFTAINGEVDALEHKCLQAMHPPLPANHGQPQVVAATNLPLSGTAQNQQYSQLLAQTLAPVAATHDQVLRAEQVQPYNEHPAPQPHGVTAMSGAAHIQQNYQVLVQPQAPVVATCQSEDQGAQASPVFP